MDKIKVNRAYKFKHNYFKTKRVEVLDLTRINTIKARLESSGIHIGTLADYTGLKRDDLATWLSLPSAEILTAIEVAIVQLECKLNTKTLQQHKEELEVLLEHPEYSYNRIEYLKLKIKQYEKGF